MPLVKVMRSIVTILSLSPVVYNVRILNTKHSDDRYLYIDSSDIIQRSSRVRNPGRVPDCPEVSPLLLGPLTIVEDIEQDFVNQKLFKEWFGDRLDSGGVYQPPDCRARQRVAVIVPYRDRESHLLQFLHHIHPFLQRQQLNYRVFVIEQSRTEQFNRGTLLNIGFAEASQINEYDCFIFHDVDLLPEDDRNSYLCHDEEPKHLISALNKWNYRLLYNTTFGGVTAVSKKQFSKLNGYANSYYGWGGEDDDFFNRIKAHNLKFLRSPGNIGRYYMIPHGKVEANENLNDLMKMSSDNKLAQDGLKTLNYTKLDQENFLLYTWILVQIPKGPKFVGLSLFKSIHDEIQNSVKFLNYIWNVGKEIQDPNVKLNLEPEETEKIVEIKVY